MSEPELALAALQRQGVGAVQNGSAIMLEHTDNPALARIVKNLVERDHSIYRVEEKRKSLEDLFLQIVGEGKL